MASGMQIQTNIDCLWATRHEEGKRGRQGAYEGCLQLRTYFHTCFKSVFTLFHVLSECSLRFSMFLTECFLICSRVFTCLPHAFSEQWLNGPYSGTSALNRQPLAAQPPLPRRPYGLYNRVNDHVPRHYDHITLRHHNVSLTADIYGPRDDGYETTN
jgi:hypothetical protein